MAKQKVTCLITGPGFRSFRQYEKREIYVNESGQRYVIGDDKLRYRLDDFNEYEYRYGSQTKHTGDVDG